jgi:hypothetical protein
MKDVEIRGVARGEIRAGEEIEAVAIARANLRRAHERIVNPEGIASEHRGPKANEPNARARLNRPIATNGPIATNSPVATNGPIATNSPVATNDPIATKGLTKLHLQPDSPSDR